MSFNLPFKRGQKAFASRDAAFVTVGLLIGIILPSSIPHTLPSTSSENLPNTAHVSRLVTSCATTGEHIYGRTLQTIINDINVSYASWTWNPDNDKRVHWPPLHSAVKNVMKFPYPIDVLDVGANSGIVTLPLLAMNRGYRVMSVEPVKQNLEVICKSALLNNWLYSDKLFLIHAAFSDRVDEETIFIPEGRGDNAAISSSAATTHVGGNVKEEKIHLIDGDTMLEQTGFKPHVIKIDTQGHELFVMRGLKRYLSSAKKGELLVIAEFDWNLMKNSGVDAIDVIRFMTSLGYSPVCEPKLEVVGRKIIVVEGNRFDVKSYPPPAEYHCGDVYYVKE